MKKEKTKGDEALKGETLTFFLIAFPTILIMGMGLLVPNSWWVQIGLAFYQFLLLKQFLNRYYEVF